MSSRAGSRILVLVLSAGAALGAPAAAHAERAVTRDAAADAVSITYTEAEDGSEEEVIAPAPEQTSVDITRTVVQHRAHRLRLTASFRDLVLRRRTPHFTAFRVVTPRAAYWVYVGDMRSLMPAASTGSSQRGATAILSRGSRPVECPGLRWARDEDTDKVMASVPTPCLESPRWVQVGVGAVEFDTASMTPESEQMLTFADDGHRPGSISQNSIAKGPRVRRG